MKCAVRSTEDSAWRAIRVGAGLAEFGQLRTVSLASKISRNRSFDVVLFGLGIIRCDGAALALNGRDRRSSRTWSSSLIPHALCNLWLAHFRRWRLVQFT